MTWISPEERFVPSLQKILMTQNAQALWDDAVTCNHYGLHTEVFGKSKLLKNHSNPFTQLAASFVGQWVRWLGYTSKNYQLVDNINYIVIAQSHEYEDQWKEWSKMQPFEYHYKSLQTPVEKISVPDGTTEWVNDENWNSGFPYSEAQFKPAVGSIGEIKSVALQPYQVTQLTDFKQLQGCRIKVNPNVQHSDPMKKMMLFMLVATVEWYRMPFQDKRLAKPTPYTNNYFGIKPKEGAENSDDLRGYICWPIQITFEDSDEGIKEDSFKTTFHTHHQNFYDPFLVWNNSRNNIYIGNEGISLSTPFGQTQIINRAWSTWKH